MATQRARYGLPSCKTCQRRSVIQERQSRPNMKISPTSVTMLGYRVRTTHGPHHLLGVLAEPPVRPQNAHIVPHAEGSRSLSDGRIMRKTKRTGCRANTTPSFSGRRGRRRSASNLSRRLEAYCCGRDWKDMWVVRAMDSRKCEIDLSR